MSSDLWVVRVLVWPFAGHQATMKAEVSPEIRACDLKAVDFNEAKTLAETFRLGVASHDKVWQANIVELCRKDYR